MNKSLCIAKVLSKYQSKQVTDPLLEAVAQEDRIQRIISTPPRISNDLYTFSLSMEIYCKHRETAPAHSVSHHLSQTILAIIGKLLQNDLAVESDSAVTISSLEIILSAMRMSRCCDHIRQTIFSDDSNRIAVIVGLTRLSCLERFSSHFRSLCLENVLELSHGLSFYWICQQSIATKEANIHNENEASYSIFDSIIRAAKLLRSPDSWKYTALSTSFMQLILEILDSLTFLESSKSHPNDLINQMERPLFEMIVRQDWRWLLRLFYDRRSDLRIVSIKILHKLLSLIRTEKSKTDDHVGWDLAMPDLLKDAKDSLLRLVQDASENVYIRCLALNAIVVSVDDDIDMDELLLRPAMAASCDILRLYNCEEVIDSSGRIDDRNQSKLITWRAAASITHFLLKIVSKIASKSSYPTKLSTFLSSQRDGSRDVMNIFENLKIFPRLLAFLQPETISMVSRATFLRVAYQDISNGSSDTIFSQSNNHHGSMEWSSWSSDAVRGNVLSEEKSFWFVTCSHIMRIFLHLRCISNDNINDNCYDCDHQSISNASSLSYFQHLLATTNISGEILNHFTNFDCKPLHPSHSDRSYRIYLFEMLTSILIDSNSVQPSTKMPSNDLNYPSEVLSAITMTLQSEFYRLFPPQNHSKDGICNGLGTAALRLLGSILIRKDWRDRLIADSSETEGNSMNASVRESYGLSSLSDVLLAWRHRASLKIISDNDESFMNRLDYVLMIMNHYNPSLQSLIPANPQDKVQLNQLDRSSAMILDHFNRVRESLSEPLPASKIDSPQKTSMSSNETKTALQSLKKRISSKELTEKGKKNEKLVNASRKDPARFNRNPRVNPNIWRSKTRAYQITANDNKSLHVTDIGRHHSKHDQRLWQSLLFLSCAMTRNSSNQEIVANLCRHEEKKTKSKSIASSKQNDDKNSNVVLKLIRSLSLWGNQHVSHEKSSQCSNPSDLSAAAMLFLSSMLYRNPFCQTIFNQLHVSKLSMSKERESHGICHMLLSRGISSETQYDVRLFLIHTALSCIRSKSSNISSSRTIADIVVEYLNQLFPAASAVNPTTLSQQPWTILSLLIELLNASIESTQGPSDDMTNDHILNVKRGNLSHLLVRMLQICDATIHHVPSISSIEVCNNCLSFIASCHRFIGHLTTNTVLVSHVKVHIEVILLSLTQTIHWHLSRPLNDSSTLCDLEISMFVLWCLVYHSSQVKAAIRPHLEEKIMEWREFIDHRMDVAADRSIIQTMSYISLSIHKLQFLLDS